MFQAVARAAHKTGWICVAACALAWSAPVALARQADTGVQPPATVTLAQLPAQGRTTYRRILAGGPFPYEKDGTVFGNRERLLPIQRRGYYLEYTVRTPGVRSRGARRIICGGAARTPDVCYYTGDHYASFRRITP